MGDIKSLKLIGLEAAYTVSLKYFYWRAYFQSRIVGYNENMIITGSLS